MKIKVLSYNLLWKNIKKDRFKKIGKLLNKLKDYDFLGIQESAQWRKISKYIKKDYAEINFTLIDDIHIIFNHKKWMVNKVITGNTVRGQEGRPFIIAFFTRKTNRKDKICFINLHGPHKWDDKDRRIKGHFNKRQWYGDLFTTIFKKTKVNLKGYKIIITGDHNLDITPGYDIYNYKKIKMRNYKKSEKTCCYYDQNHNIFKGKVTAKFDHILTNFGKLKTKILDRKRGLSDHLPIISKIIY